MLNFLESIVHEDLGRGDLFTQILESYRQDYIANQQLLSVESFDKTTQACIIAKQYGIFSGEVYAKKICSLYNITCEFLKHDTQEFHKQDTLVILSGKYVDILQIERSLLNILQHSSGIATLTRQYVAAIKDYPIVLLDTRKTRPLLRELEKYSVRNGGARNHRMGLDSMLMLKDTHMAHIQGNLNDFIKYARKKLPFGISIEVECENIEEVERALKAEVDIIMCDNMQPTEITQSIALKNTIKPTTLIELSGNIRLDNIVEYAKTGADALSVGAIIHQATWIDISMKMK